MPNCNICNGDSSACVECNNTYYLYTASSTPTIWNVCDLCNGENRYKTGVSTGAGKCYRCANKFSNCDTCGTNGTGTSCTKCLSNLFLFSSNNDGVKDTCVACTSANQYKSSVSNPNGTENCYLCSTSITSCDTCSASDNCSTCLASNFKLDSNSDSKYEACTACDTDNQYYQDAANKICALCSSKIAFCLTCNVLGTSCLTCSGNRKLSSSTNTSGVYDQCIDNACASNKYEVTSPTNACLLCSDSLSNCNICNGNKDVCTTCQPTYYKLVVDTKVTCSKCDSDNTHYQNGAADGSGQCDLCSTAINNCLKCSLTGVCSECQPGFTRQQINPTTYGCLQSTLLLNYNYVQSVNGQTVAFACNTKLPNCSECSSDGSVCNSCESTQFYLKNGSCNKCSNKIFNCLECSEDGSLCTKCFAGTYLFDNRQQCISCSLTGQFKFVDDNSGLGVCRLCNDFMPNCKECNSSSVCLTCGINYYLHDSNSDGKTESCLDCSTTFYFKSGTENGSGKCKVCPESISNCLECTSDGKSCLKCQSGFALSSQQASGAFQSCISVESCNSLIMFVTAAEPKTCIVCSQKISGCSLCTEKKSQAHCIQCSANKYLFDSNIDGTNDSCMDCLESGKYKEGASDGTGICGVCSQKFPGCSECAANGRTCSVCTQPLILKSSTEDPLYLDSCISPSACPLTSHYISQSKCELCQVAIPNCVNCNNDPTQCASCSNDFYLMDSLNSGKYDRCTTCTASEYFRSGDNTGSGKCIRCESRYPNCRLCSAAGDQCLQCYGHYYLFDSDGDSKFDKCLDCSSPELTKAQGAVTETTGKGVCKKCSEVFPGCKKCTFEVGCTECAISIQLPYQSAWTKKYDSCISECKSDYYYADSGKCSLCSNAMSFCEVCKGSSKVCHKCSSPHTLMDANNDGVFETCSSCSDVTTYTDPASGLCLACSTSIKNCKECSGSTRLCSRCESGYYILEQAEVQQSSCVTCNEPNQYKEKLDSISGITLCKNCSLAVSNCVNCNGSSSSCTLCKPGYYLLDTNTNASQYEKCDACTMVTHYQSGPADGSGSCKPCSVLISGCSECEKNLCKKCELGKFLFSSNGTSDFDSCVSQCPSSTFPDVEAYKCVSCSASISSCLLCNGNKSSCSKCESGLSRMDFDNDGMFEQCSECKSLEYATAGVLDGTSTCNRCFKSINGCDKCQGGTCLSCLEGYELANGKCTKLCPIDRYPAQNADGTSKCELCSSAISKCLECRVSTICDVCQANHVQKAASDPCVSISSVIPGCLKSANTAKISCAECDPTYSLLDGICVSVCPDSHYKVQATEFSYVCKPCGESIEGCFKCFGQKDSCRMCSVGYYLADLISDSTYRSCLTCNEVSRYRTGSEKGQGVCNLCSVANSFCESCFGNPNSCSKCVKGLYILKDPLNPSLQTCNKCTDASLYKEPASPSDGTGSCLYCNNLIENCELCQSNSCLKCKPGYYLQDSRNDGVFTSCVSCTGPTTFISSPANDGTGVCKSCRAKDPFCSECDKTDGKCSNCMYGKHLSLASDSTTSCVNCNGADTFFELVDGVSTCKPCSSSIEGCSLCAGNKSYCKMCRASRYLLDQNLDGHFETCSDCKMEGYITIGLSDGSGLCKACSDAITNCKKCEDYDSCKICKPGFYLYHGGDKVLCTPCTESSSFRSGLDDGTGTCIPCSASINFCATCSDGGSICSKCELNKYLFDPYGGSTFTQCIDCSDSSMYALESMVKTGTGVCKPCRSAIENCEICNGLTTSCSKCQQGYFLFSSNYDSSYDKCVLCDSPEEFIDDRKITNGLGLCKRCDSVLPKCKICNGDKVQCSVCKDDLTRYDSNLDGIYWNCVQCPSSLYFVKEGTCFRCFTQSKNPHCLECLDESTCSRCRQGFELSANKTCVPLDGIYSDPNAINATQKSVDALRISFFVGLALCLSALLLLA